MSGFARGALLVYRRLRPSLTPGSDIATMSIEYWQATWGELPKDPGPPGPGPADPRRARRDQGSGRTAHPRLDASTARNRGTLPTRQERTMTDPQLFSIIGSVLGVGIALAALIIGLIAWLRADMKTDRAEAAADRRAFQAAMDDFRHAMQRLGERQAHVEGRVDATAADD